MKKLMPTHLFIRKLIRNILIGIALTIFALGIGMAGYSYFEGMSAVEAFENAAMILSGMGPVTPMHTSAGRFFAGCYAIFSGTLFLVIIAVVMAPVIHRFLQKFHLDDSENKK